MKYINTNTDRIKHYMLTIHLKHPTDNSGWFLFVRGCSILRDFTA